MFPSQTQLIRIPGKKNWKPVLISTLLHGNETTGFQALKILFEKWGTAEWLRPVWILYGNPEAAREFVRHLPHQPDFNRIWGSEHPISQQFLPELLRGNFAFCIDIHNTTGINPHYSALTRTDSLTLGLSSLFSPLAVHFTTPPGTLTGALAPHFTSITIECGQSGSIKTEQEISEFLAQAIHLETAPQYHSHKNRIQLFESFAQIKILSGASFSFEGQHASSDFKFARNFDQANFTSYSEGHIFAWKKSKELRLQILTSLGEDVSDEYFDQDGYTVKVKKSFTPSLLTQAPEIVRSDCLGYVMNPIYHPS
jgi:succinylglutamate desuccinylase